MEIYHYHPLTKEYLGKTDADQDPENEGLYLIPAHATTKPVPEFLDWKCPVFDTEVEEWNLVDDFRGAVLYSINTGDVIAAKLGESPESLGATLHPRPTEAYVWDGESWGATEEAMIQYWKSIRLSQVEAIARQAREAMRGSASMEAMACWPAKVEEARAFLEGSKRAAKNLTDEASARGVDVEWLASRVIEKSSQLSSLEAKIAGSTGRHKDAIRRLAEHFDVTALEQYDVEAGW